MVEVAIVLVEVHQHHRLAPDVRHGGQRVQDFLQEPRALHRAGRAGMLAIDRGRIHPADLRQLAFADVALERVQVVLGRGTGQGIGDALVKRIVGVVGRRVVGMVGQRLAGVGIRHARFTAAGYGKARRDVRAAERLERAEHVVAPFVGHVLVRDPANAGVF
ncbi:hypothetical protein D3C71_1451870 [compost metagenome]